MSYLCVDNSEVSPFSSVLCPKCQSYTSGCLLQICYYVCPQQMLNVTHLSVSSFQSKGNLPVGVLYVPLTPPPSFYYLVHPKNSLLPFSFSSNPGHRHIPLKFISSLISPSPIVAVVLAPVTLVQTGFSWAPTSSQCLSLTLFIALREVLLRQRSGLYHPSSHSFPRQNKHVSIRRLPRNVQITVLAVAFGTSMGFANTLTCIWVWFCSSRAM